MKVSVIDGFNMIFYLIYALVSNLVRFCVRINIVIMHKTYKNVKEKKEICNNA